MQCRREKERGRAPASRALSLMLSTVLMFGYCGIPLAFADDTVVASTSGAATVASVGTQDQTSTQLVGDVVVCRDITDAWNNGALTIDEAGHYYLSGDVQTSDTLTISAPEGAEISFDFNGHTATVAGTVVAGIDVSASMGTVSITDSAYEDGDVATCLTVEAVKAQDAVCGILWNAAESTKDATSALSVSNVGVAANLNTVDASVQDDSMHDCYGIYLGYAYDTDQQSLDAAIDNCAFTVNLNNIELTSQQEQELLDTYGEKPLSEGETGIASSIFTKVGGIKLSSKFVSTPVSVNNICDLYSTVVDAFTLENGFSTDRALRVYSAGNIQGVPFATLGEEIEAIDELSASFTDASANGLVCSVSGDSLVFTVKSANADTSATGEAVDDTVVVKDSGILPAGAALGVSVPTDETASSLGTTMASSSLPSLLTMMTSLLDTGDVTETHNLNTEWAAQTGGYASSFRITESGTYYLSGDLATDAQLVINGAGIDVIIELGGYDLAIRAGGSANTSGITAGSINIISAESLTIDGTGKDATEISKLVTDVATAGSAGSYGKMYGAAIYSTASRLTVRNISIDMAPSDKIYTLSCAGVCAESGEVTLENCSVNLDISAQTSFLSSYINEHPYGVYLGSSVSKATVIDCNLSAIASSYATSTVTSGTYGQTAYGLYSVAAGLVTVEGGSFSATSWLGSASAIYGTNITVQNDTSGNGVALEASAKNSVFGFESTAIGGITLDSTLTFAAFGGTLDAAIASTAEKAFVIGASFAGSDLGVFAGSDTATANGDGVYFATYASEPTSERMSQLADMFSNALGSDAPCDVIADANGLGFEIDASKAVASVVHADGMTAFYASFSLAIDAIAPGETVKLLKSVTYGIDFPAKGDADDTFTIDLNGHDIAYVSDSATGTVTVCDTSTGEKGSIIGGDANSISARLISTGTLVVDGVDITTSTVSSSYGVVYNTSTGKIVLNDVNLSARTTATTYGVRNYGAGTLEVTGGSIDITSTGTTYGVWVNRGASTTVKNCPITVTSTGNAYGLFAVASSTSVIGGIISAEADQNANISCSGSNVYAICGANNSSISLKSYSVAASGTTSYVYCYSSGTLANAGTLTGTLTLDGTCSFDAPIAIKTAIKLGSSFALADGSAAISLQNTSMTGDVFAVASDGASDISAAASCFTPAAGSIYANWMVGTAENGTELIWTNDPLVKNVTKTNAAGSDVQYASLSTAIDAASDGDELELVADYAQSSTLTIDKAITFDLAGKTLVISAGTEGATGALAYTGAGTFTLKDSAEDKGRLDITVGSSDENIAGAYAGVANQGGGTLIVDDCQVAVTYTGATSSSGSDTCAITLYGIYNQTSAPEAEILLGATLEDAIPFGSGVQVSSVTPGGAAEEAGVEAGDVITAIGETAAGSLGNLEPALEDKSAGDIVNLTLDRDGETMTVTLTLDDVSGSVTVQGATTVQVNACEADAAFGAMDAYGIYLGNRASAVTVADTATIHVSNNAEGIEQGSVINRLTTPSFSTLNWLNPNLIEISPDEGSSLYNEIQEKFKQVAQFDDGTSAGGLGSSDYAYGAQIYYAAPLELIDGTAVWAFSDPVPADQVGDPDAIVATKMYVQSMYTSVPQSYGIGASSTATGDVDVAGDISAVSANGNAYAVDAVGTGTWTLSASTLSATGGQDSYKQLGNSIDLNEVLGLNLSTTGSVFYNGSAHLVSYVKPEAVGISAASSDTSIILDGEISVTTDAASTCDISSAPLFSLGASFTLAQGADPLTVENPDGDNQVGVVFATAADGVTLADEVRTLFIDAGGMLSPELSDNQLVWDDTYAVSFVCEDSTVQTDDGVLYGDSVTLPDANSLWHLDSAGYTYEFLGWSTNENAALIDVSVSDIPAGTTTLTVTGSATYYAIFAKIADQKTLTFTNIHDSTGTAIADVGVSISYGQTLSEALYDANISLPQPADYTVGTTTYRFVGWHIAGTTSGGNQVWDPRAISSSLAYDSTLSTSTLTAYYVSVSQNQYLVTFKVDYMLSAYAVADGAIATYADAYAATGTTTAPSKLATEDGNSYTFKGWYVGWSTNATYASSKDVTYTTSDSLPTATADAAYTARFEETTELCTLSLVYYKQNSSGTYFYLTNDPTTLQLPYGTDPITYANALVTKNFTQDNMVYSFLGWSMRQSDKKPVYITSLPALTTTATSTGSSGVKYYAIYSEAELTASIRFYVDDSLYATASDVSASQTIDGAFSVSDNPTTPADHADGTVFRGWSIDPDATEPDRTSLVTVGDTSSTTYYAVYGDPDQQTVTFYDDDGSSVIKQISVILGKTVEDSGFAPTNPSKAASYFTGWVDGSGNAFDIDTDTVTKDLKLYATYGTIANDVASDTGISADLSSAFLNNEGIEDATGAQFTLETALLADANLSSQAKTGDNTLLGTHTVQMSYTIDDVETVVTSGFGTVTLTLPVSSDYTDNKIKVYWLKTDGTVGISSAKTVSNGAVTFALTDYATSLFGGNLALAAVPTDAQVALALNISNALSQLREVYEEYRQGDYTEDGWDVLEKAYEDGNYAIEAATTPDEAVAAANAAITAMAAVAKDTSADVAAAKAEALQKLAESYAGFSKSNYTDANWEALVEAYETAKSSIDAAATTTDAFTAANNGVSAMGAVTTGTGSSTSTTTASGLSSSTGSSGSGLSSSSGSSGSGLSSSSGSDTAGASLSSTSSDAESRLGATLETVTSDLVTEAGLKVDTGVYVSSVIAGGAAEQAGIQVGDVITAVDGEAVDSLDALEAALADKNTGDTVELTLDRDGATIPVTLTLGEASNSTALLKTGSVGDTNDPAVDSGDAEQTEGGLGAWLRDHIVLACIAGLVLLALIGTLVWWLLRRRHQGGTDADFEEGVDEGADSQPEAAEADGIQF